MKQRGSFAITVLILSAIFSTNEQGITKTKIMQEVMLNHKRVNRYLLNLMEKGLIDYQPKTRHYRMRPKGIIVLQLSEQLADYIYPIHKMIERYEAYFQNESLVCSNN
jgi:predicted transcriptional regulator